MYVITLVFWLINGITALTNDKSMEALLRFILCNHCKSILIFNPQVTQSCYFRANNEKYIGQSVIFMGLKCERRCLKTINSISFTLKAILIQPVTYLKGVGPKTARSLQLLGLRRVGDLLLHLPRSLIDW